MEKLKVGDLVICINEGGSGVDSNFSYVPGLARGVHYVVVETHELLEDADSVFIRVCPADIEEWKRVFRNCGLHIMVDFLNPKRFRKV